ncbi:MAG: hypothetical protein ACTSSE_13290 [Candidatus Thorarchaeota archaeon]
MSGSDCVRVVAEEILKGQIIGLSEPLSYSGITIVPIERLGADICTQRTYVTKRESYSVHKVIVRSLPKNTCGVFVLDSLGDILAFKLHKEISTFWERIDFIEKLVLEHYKDTRKPLSKISASSKAVAFLMKLKLEGPEGIMNSESDYFAVSRTDCAQEDKKTDLLSSTAAVLYCAASQ